MLKVYAQTHVGMIRSNNEDNYLVMNTTSASEDFLPAIQQITKDNYPAVLMVSDGMGGAAAGEVASLIAVNTVAKAFENAGCNSDLSALIETSLQQANQEIIAYSLAHPGTYGMGATATLAVILDNRLYIGQIGDSRAYLIRNNTIRQLTRDQSYVNQLVEAGKITEEEAEHHPRRNIILQALGSEDHLDVARCEETLEHMDRLLLCSDGLSAMIPRNDILRIIRDTEDLDIACAKLVNRANENGGHDNITIVLAEWHRK